MASTTDRGRVGEDLRARRAGHAPTIEVEGLGVGFGARPALHGVDLVARAGLLTAVTGPSGAGKSTLLWSVAGALGGATVEGRVLIGGTPVRPDGGRAATLTLGVGLIPQGNGLASVLTARENCLVPLLDAGVGPAPAARRVADALAAVGLEESGEHLIEELSGGQQQRVAVARALAARPAVLLADEPTSELDHANRERVLELLHDLAASGCTVLMATHDPEAAEQAAAEVHLDEGRVVGRR